MPHCGTVNMFFALHHMILLAVFSHSGHETLVRGGSSRHFSD